MVCPTDYDLRFWFESPCVACEKVASDIRLVDGLSYILLLPVMAFKPTNGV